MKASQCRGHDYMISDCLVTLPDRDKIYIVLECKHCNKLLGLGLSLNNILNYQGPSITWGSERDGE